MMNFGHLPYAMSGVNAWLDPAQQQDLSQPFQVTGATVPQNTWDGTTFNIPPRPTSKSPAIPAAPPKKQSITTPGGWDPKMFEPLGLYKPANMASWPQPQGPAPAMAADQGPGYVWDAHFGYYRPWDWSQDSNDTGE